MAPIVPSSEMLFALGFALLVILLAALVLHFYSPLTSVPSISTSPKRTSKAASDTMAPVIVLSQAHAMGLETQSLLDLPSPEQFNFPALQPQTARGTGLTASNFARDPIIREGSPIDLTPETVKQRHTNDERIQYRPAHDSGTNEQYFDIRWALGKATVFDNPHEEVAAARHPGNIIGRRLSENMFFQWGLRYIPSAPAVNVYRTVLIEKLPQGISLDQILPRIRGGQIYSATLCDTTNLTQYWTALIIFVHEAGASSFLRRVEQEGLYVGFTAVSVRRVPTPTYLFNPSLMQGIRQQGRTRCLAVCSPEPTLKAILHKILTNSGLSEQVECFGEKDPEGATSIRFHSIKAAVRAYEVLVDTKNLKLAVDFIADPCSL